MFNWFYWWRQRRKLKRDPITEYLVDEDIRHRVIEFGKTIASLGVTAEQAVANVKRNMRLTRDQSHTR